MHKVRNKVGYWASMYHRHTWSCVICFADWVGLVEHETQTTSEKNNPFLSTDNSASNL